jgi:hypothetical protein
MRRHVSEGERRGLLIRCARRGETITLERLVARTHNSAMLYSRGHASVFPVGNTSNGNRGYSWILVTGWLGFSPSHNCDSRGHTVRLWDLGNGPVIGNSMGHIEAISRLPMEGALRRDILSDFGTPSRLKSHQTHHSHTFRSMSCILLGWTTFRIRTIVQLRDPTNGAAIGQPIFTR